MRRRGHRMAVAARLLAVVAATVTATAAPELMAMGGLSATSALEVLLAVDFAVNMAGLGTSVATLVVVLKQVATFIGVTVETLETLPAMHIQMQGAEIIKIMRIWTIWMSRTGHRYEQLGNSV